jgi:hypothetical protein
MQFPQRIDCNSSARAHELYEQQRYQNSRRIDRMFAVLMVLQWVAAIIVACHARGTAQDVTRIRMCGWRCTLAEC